MLIKANNISKSFADTTIIDDLSFSINKGDKVALIGRNGIGKTTLLNIIAGIDLDFEGELIKNKDISYVAQKINTDDDRNLFYIALSYFDELTTMKNKITKLEKEIHKPNRVALEETYAKLLNNCENSGGYEIENRVKKVMSGLGFTKADLEKTLNMLSGGEIRRFSLARILLSDASLIILDEPTNHLDIFAIKWLEDFLKGYKKAMLIASHDKYFIKAVASKIIELPSNKVYKGNYDFFIEEQEKEYAKNAKEYAEEQKKIAREKEFILRNIAGQKTKQAKSRRKALEKLKPMKLLKREHTLNIKFHNAISSIEQIAYAKNTSKSFNNTTLIDKVSLSIEKGDKIGIIGKNASGKTTLVKALLDKTDNTTFLNTDIKTAYFSQYNIKSKLTVFEEVYNANNTLSKQEIYNILASFQFDGDDIHKKVEMLSGGELTKLSLICILIKEADFFILDEPTNHLDIITREALAKALSAFKGSVLCISHDRSFLDTFVNKILLLEKGKLSLFYGNYKDNKDKIIPKAKKQSNTNATKGKLYQKKKNINIYKLKSAEENIALLENRKKELTNKLQSKYIYTDYEKVKKVKMDIEIIETKLQNEYDNWLSMQGN